MPAVCLETREGTYESGEDTGLQDLILLNPNRAQPSVEPGVSKGNVAWDWRRRLANENDLHNANNTICRDSVARQAEGCLDSQVTIMPHFEKTTIGIPMGGNDDCRARNLKFFADNAAGCAFAAIAAKNPEKFQWTHSVLPEVAAGILDSVIETAVADPASAMHSVIFPRISTVAELCTLISCINECSCIFVEQDVIFADYRCIGIRVRVGNEVSWVSGFGPFAFFPATRRAPYTEITFRAKPRPRYEKTMKKAPAGVIHLADLEMLGMSDNMFKNLWRASISRTAQLLGHKPNLQSAAKTTFILPRAEEGNRG